MRWQHYLKTEHRFSISRTVSFVSDACLQFVRHLNDEILQSCKRNWSLIKISKDDVQVPSVSAALGWHKRLQPECSKYFQSETNLEANLPVEYNVRYLLLRIILCAVRFKAVLLVSRHQLTLQRFRWIRLPVPCPFTDPTLTATQFLCYHTVAIIFIKHLTAWAVSWDSFNRYILITSMMTYALWHNKAVIIMVTSLNQL